MSARQNKTPASVETVIFRIVLATSLIILAFSAVLLFTLPLWGL